MTDIIDCPRCGSLYAKNAFRDVCPQCYRAEEDLFQEVYHFLRKRENRAATRDRLIEATGATDDLISKWVRKGRLQPALFPNLGYPCDRCGAIIQTGKICDKCVKELETDLKTHETNERFSAVPGVPRQTPRAYLGRTEK